MPGTGTVTVNNKELKQYFILSSHAAAARSPLDQLKLVDFDVTVHVVGGGIHAQAEAIRLGLSRAIVLKDPKVEAAPSRHRLHDSRLSHGRAQKVWQEESAPQSPVGEALSIQELYMPNHPREYLGWFLSVQKLDKLFHFALGSRNE